MELEEKISKINADVEAFKSQALEKLSVAEKFSAEAKEQVEKGVAKVEELGKRLTEAELAMKAASLEQKKDERSTFTQNFAKMVQENHKEIQGVRKGKSFDFDLKVVGDMTVADNLTGNPFINFDPQPKLVPSVKLNFRDLVGTINSSTGNLTITRETGSEGSISEQGTPGVAKSQIDYDYTAVNFASTYLAGYARYAKQMAANLPFLESYLPQQLLRDFYKAENSAFYTDLATAATPGTAVDTTEIERIMSEVATLENLDYGVNGIVLNPTDWYNIAKTKPSDFSLPATVAYVGGQLVVNGIPVFKATWVPADKAFIGDWSYAKRAQTEGLKVEFFEQDADNVTKNLVTARIECFEVLVIERPDAFTLLDLGNLT